MDLLTETLVTLSAAAKLVPGSVLVSTLHRWRQRGVRGIKLETVLLGGRRFTSREALERFSAAVTSAANGKTAVSSPSAARRRSIELAERQLNEAGM